MSEKTREICTVVSQESIGAGIYSMWKIGRASCRERV